MAMDEKVVDEPALICCISSSLLPTGSPASLPAVYKATMDTKIRAAMQVLCYCVVTVEGRGLVLGAV